MNREDLFDDVIDLCAVSEETKGIPVFPTEGEDDLS